MDTEQNTIRRKGVTYLVLTVVLAVTSILSAFFIKRYFGDESVFISLSFLTPQVLLGIFALLFVYLLLDALRFYFVLRAVEIQIPFLYVIKLSFINIFVSAITPFATGGGFAQIYFLVRKGTPLGSATAASSIRSLLAVAFFLVAAPVVILINPSLLSLVGENHMWVVAGTVAVFCGVVILLLWLVYNEKQIKRLSMGVFSFLTGKHIVSLKRARKLNLAVFREVRGFNAGLSLFLRGSKKYVALSVLSTILFLFTLFSFPVLLTGAMNYKIPSILIYQSQILITFIMYFGLTPGATGIAEGGFALLFSSHVAKEDIVSLTVLWRFFTVYAGTVVGLLLFYIELFRTSVARKAASRKAFEQQEGKLLRIAMFTNNYYPFIGGVPISIERLASALRSLGHYVVIFAPEYKTQSGCAEDGVIRCKLLLLLKTKLFNFHIVNIFSRKIEREFARHNFDIVHVHHPFWMGTKGVSLARKYGIPAVMTYHTRFDMYHHYVPVCKRYFKKYLSHRIVLHFAQSCDMVFAPVESSAKYLNDLGVTKPIEIMPTGVKLLLGGNAEKLRKTYTPNGELLLCSVSRLAREKNIFFLLEGIKYIKSYGKTAFKCVIIGDGPERAEIEKFIETENLSDTVILTGTVEPDCVGMFYFATDIFVYASKSETQGMVLIEAMAGHCPVVAVSSGGVDDVVKCGCNGCKTSEDIAEWAQKVMLLMENENLRKEMSENAAAFAGKFSAENVAAQAVRAYTKVITDV
ncbi:MAG: flippase-like domain-containing protein [Clostridiales bacterium]|jgi:uncharacterized protein (TIRG00374 family)|nr:flippase-like domain-containing protein [Clostridiales bacterium]